MFPPEIKENIPLAPYTIYKIGGPARYFVEVKDGKGFEDALQYAVQKAIPIFVLGAGSNVLVSDNGFPGMVIHMKDGDASVEGEYLHADAGIMMAQAVLKAAQGGLSGFEWGIGVPGTIGGSVRGNAGCFGGEMAQVLEQVQVLECQMPNAKCQIRKFNNEECHFGYRDSIFKRHPEWILLSATLKLKKGDTKEIQGKIQKIVKERAQKQDIGTKTCGCIFKNVSWARSDINREELCRKFPEFEEFRNTSNLPASFLIDRAGLKGRSFGSVYISPKHANFFVNEGGASAEEVLKLITIAKDAVREKYGVLLEEEIVYV